MRGLKFKQRDMMVINRNKVVALKVVLKRLFGQWFKSSWRVLVSFSKFVVRTVFTTKLFTNPVVRFCFCSIKALFVCGVVFFVAAFVLPFFSTLLFLDQVLASISSATQLAINDAYERIFVQNNIPMTEYGATSLITGLYLSKHFWFLFVSGLLGVSFALWRFNVGWTKFRALEAEIAPV